MKFTQKFWEDISRVKEAILSADAVIVGAGSGLSTAAGYVYSGKRFNDNFADFVEKYGFRDMYSGGFGPFECAEEMWCYWARYIYINRYVAPPKPVYEKLLDIVKGSNYFVITTNVDHCFQRAGFDKNRLFYTQGDFGLFQCSVHCHDKTYDNEGVIRKMYQSQSDMKVAKQLFPRCPVCGKPMTFNLRSDDKFVEDDGWRAACERYEKFINENKDKKVVYLELGVGGNTPVIIKYPFIRATYANKNATYVCINMGEAFCPQEIADRSIIINDDIAAVIDAIDSKTDE